MKLADHRFLFTGTKPSSFEKLHRAPDKARIRTRITARLSLGLRLKKLSSSRNSHREHQADDKVS